jgi:hypothetical protein
LKKKYTLFAIILGCIFFHLQGQQSPDMFLGKTVGADKTLVVYPDIMRYFDYLGKQSPRVKVTVEGTSTLDNKMFLACISSAENITALDDLLAINRRLADPAGLTEREASALIEKSKVFVLVTATIHASEVGASQMAMIWAHQLATGDDPWLKEILDNVVVLLMPSLNPDGNIMVTEWYEKNLGTPHEGSRMPYLYHHYAGHDTNRDFYMLNLKETRVVNRILHHKYFPHIFLDMHQMGTAGPRMFVPPFKDPLNKNLDPRLVRETNLIGSFMAMKLQESGKKGVANSYGFDAYWPGGSKNTAWFKNVVGVLTELASTQMATPVFVDPNELRASAKGLPEYKAQVNFPDPWPGGWWRLRDIIDYELIAADALIELASQNRRSFVSNFYAMGRDNCDVSNLKGTFGYVIPTDQWDAPAAITFLRKMEEHGIKIYTFARDYIAGQNVYKKGTFLIPLDQPYRDFIQVMMEKQVYPEILHVKGGPIMEPYDSAGWTLPVQMGVSYEPMRIPAYKLPVRRVSGIDYPQETVPGNTTGKFYRIPGRYNRSYVAVNRLFKRKTPLYRATSASSQHQVEAGDFLVKSSDISSASLWEVLSGTGVDVAVIAGDEDKLANVPLKAPKIGIYQSYIARIDEGWTRFVLDSHEFSYTVLHNRDFKNKKRLASFDVIVIPDMTRDLIVDGVVKGRYAYYYANGHPDYKGGIGAGGLGNLKEFVRKGGNLVLLDHASVLAIDDFKLPLANRLKNVRESDFYCPGSLLELHVNRQDPIGWGMPAKTALLFSDSAAFNTRVPQKRHISRHVAGYFSAEGPHLLSGYLKGEKRLNRTAMILRFGFHRGYVMVLGGRVQFRGQSSGTFKFLFNSLLHTAGVAGGTTY